MSKPIDKEQLLVQMASQVKKFAASEIVSQALKPFDDDILEDPLFTWCVKDKCDYEPSTLILLNNWDMDRGSNKNKKVAWNIDYSRGYFDRTLEITHDTFNRTFHQLFNTPWSRDRIDSHHCLTGNAVPGLWRNDKVEGHLDEDVYLRGLCYLWIPIMAAYRPSYIYLCGGWAQTLAKIVRPKLLYSPFEVTVLCHPSSRGKKLWNRSEGPDTLEEW